MIVHIYFLNRYANYYDDIGNSKYRLELLGINHLTEGQPKGKLFKENFDFLRSDHARFWYHDSKDFNLSIPALLITDTGKFRNHYRYNRTI